MPRHALLSFLDPAPHTTPLPPEKIDPEYKRLRRNVFIGIFAGYAGYYLVRTNLKLAIPDIISDFPEHTKMGLGSALAGLSIAYGLSKFLMGSVSDRSNPRRFLPLGLLISAGIIALMGTVKVVYAFPVLVVALMTLNGWVQGMGWPPCGKTMVHWYSTKERGRIVAVWNLAHNVGTFIMPWLAVAGVFIFANWGAKFYVNAIVAAGIAVFAYVLMRDTPQSCGLPPVEQYKNDYPPSYSAAHERTFTFREIFLEHVLPNRALWLIAMANGFVYYVRYGVDNWIPTYFKWKEFTDVQSSFGLLLFGAAGIPGTLLCGWLSDKVFKGRRTPATIVFMALALAGVLVYWLNVKGPVWIDYAALTIIGFFIYGPVMIIGLHAMELVPKKAAGTAAGFTGFFAYVFGAAAAGAGAGWIADRWDWPRVFITMIVSCLLAMLFSALVGGGKGGKG